MPRAATTTDSFNALAESRRREIVSVLAGQERTVTDLVEALGMAQPQVSKHLKVLREVGLVEIRKSGRTHWYRLRAEQLKPIYDWVRRFERFWDHQLSAIKVRAEAKARSVRDRN